MNGYHTESDFEKLRKENIKRNEETFKKLFPVNVLSVLKTATSPTPERRRTPKQQPVLDDVVPRRSLRRSCKREREPSPEEDRLSDEESESGPAPTYIQFGSWGKRLKMLSKNKEGDSNDLYFINDDDDDIGRTPTATRRRNTTKNVSFRPYEAVTEEDLILVAERTSEKKYDQVDGTSCHQCRQKTDDLKTVCRSAKCVGVRGQFCGPCLKNRYGECAKEAIMNREWECPPCRGICNCSFCMKKRGRSATGIMIHAAKQKGYDNVSTFLGLSVKVTE